VWWCWVSGVGHDVCFAYWVLRVAPPEGKGVVLGFRSLGRQTGPFGRAEGPVQACAVPIVGIVQV